MKKTVMMLGVLVFSGVLASASEPVCVVYFTGVGCPHCANTGPVVLGELPAKYEGDFVVIEYEVFDKTENQPVARAFMDAYEMGGAYPRSCMMVERPSLAIRTYWIRLKGSLSRKKAGVALAR